LGHLGVIPHMLRDNKKLAIVGTVGLPACYGGFETLADNLVRYAEEFQSTHEIDVYCSSKFYDVRPVRYHGARLHYLPFEANGPQSVIYDIWSMFLALLRGVDTMLVLGVSGAIILPLLRLVCRTRFVVNIDGLEWKREKWSGLARWFLRLSEAIAVRYAHVVIADNQAIVDHVCTTYGRQAHLIPYGGDNAGIPRKAPRCGVFLEKADQFPLLDYAIMLCRIEPENNVHIILEAFAADHKLPSLLAVGNWNASDYGRGLRHQFSKYSRIHMIDPVFERNRLYELRSNAAFYVHGHSAGGTNPSLVEMMWLGCPVFAFDCRYNRYTTENKAFYFTGAQDLCSQVMNFDKSSRQSNGAAMRVIARRRYRWATIGKQYFDMALLPSGID
jgi:glycosyltransferase involved in cell wall biosynthesis